MVTFERLDSSDENSTPPVIRCCCPHLNNGLGFSCVASAFFHEKGAVSRHVPGLKALVLSTTDKDPKSFRQMPIKAPIICFL